MKAIHCCLLLAISLFPACTDETWPVTSPVTDKTATVTVSLPYSVPAPDRTTTTRAVDDYAVNDLYVLAFNEAGKKVFAQHYTTGALLAATGGDAVGEQVVEATLPLGALTVYGVANTRNEVYGDVAARLDGVTTRDELLALTLEVLLEARNLSRIGATWLMAGVCNGGNPVTVTRTTTALHHIELRRLDAAVTFRFEYGANCTSFKAHNWYILNAPARTFLFEHEVPAEATTYDGWDAANTADHFYSTREQIENYTIFDNTFTFYLPENRKLPSAPLSSYAEREAQGKAPGLATAVVVNGTYEGTASGTLGDGLPVTAEVSYLIHLGYVRQVADDFFCRRNTRYTYVVTVCGVDDIVLEVETDEERAPGATGEVVFLSGSNIYTLDAHYETVLLSFPVSDLISKREGMLAQGGRFECIVSTPYTGMDGCVKEKDMAWVSFARNAAGQADRLQRYAEADRLLTVQDLLDELWEYAEGLRTDDVQDGKVTYTCFVNEFYYEKDDLPFDDPDARIRSFDDPVNLWKSFVNTDNRRIYLVCNRRYSTDGESCIMSASYILSQRSIRTIFSTGATPDEAIVAFGMETLNETGKIDWGNYTYTNGTLRWLSPSVTRVGTDNQNGWQNFLTLIGDLTWTSVVDDSVNGYRSVDQNKQVNEGTTPLIGMQSAYAYAYAACLQRNRKTSSSATLQDDELKWYLPSIHQYQDMYIGEAAMGEGRLFTYPGTPASSQAEVVSHFASSTFNSASSGACYILWAEEGSSTSTLDQDLSWTNYTSDKSKKVQVPYRCVRNLGSSAALASGAYTSLTHHDAVARRITYSPLTETARNRTRITHGELGAHSYQDVENQFYSGGFEYYTESIGGNLAMKDVTGRVQSNGSWTVTATSTVTACTALTPADGGAQWRAPNLREFTLLWQYGLLTRQEMSRTGFYYTFRNGWRNLSAGMNITMEDITYGYIRCVRDLE